MARMQLPAYPTTETLSSLIPTIQSTLQRCASSPTQHDSETYIATYAKHRAHSTLQSIVWHTDSTNLPQEITQLSFLIALRTTRPIAIHTLIDLSIVYAHSSHLHSLFQAQYNLYPLPLTESISNDALPTFTRLLASSDAHQALASKRKISESIVCFLHACSPIPALIRPFSLSKDFILALATLYDQGLTSISKSYGGFDSTLSGNVDADDWPHLWVQTKIALIDSFHIVLTALLDDQPSEVEKEYIFDTLFALIDLRAVPPSTTPSTPFLEMPLIADYHHAYNLSEKLSSILKEDHHSERDPRLDLLETSVSSLLSGIEKKNPGLLKIVLPSKDKTNTKVKSESTPAPIASSSNDTDEHLESKTAQILAILPHLSSSHVARLLRDDTFSGNVERVLEGLLDGSLSSEWEDGHSEGIGKGKEREKSNLDEGKDGVSAYDVAQRRNVFDNEELDVARVRVGKQDVGSDLLQDRSTIERMKRDILRRVEEMEEAEAELFEDENAKAKSNNPYDEDETVAGAGTILRPLGDEDSGTDVDDSSDSGSSSDGPIEPEPLDPETVIEQAYLSNPGLFDRDANTRRGKARIELRNLTGWADEQIEGWRVVLERTPGKKARLEEKYAFNGNVKGLEVPLSGPSRSGGRGRGRARGGGESSRGFRRGGRGGGGSNRKRGHDKKVAKAGGIV